MKVTDRRYVVCPACGTADYRYRGLLGDFDPARPRYTDNCRACGADFGGDRARAVEPQLQLVFAFYAVNAFVGAALAGFSVGIAVVAALEAGDRTVPLAVVLVAGACAGVYRAHLARGRGEMFVRKRKDTPIDVDAA